MKTMKTRMHDPASRSAEKFVAKPMSPETMAEMEGSAYAAVLALALTIASALAIIPFILPKIPG